MPNAFILADPEQPPVPFDLPSPPPSPASPAATPSALQSSQLPATPPVLADVLNMSNVVQEFAGFDGTVYSVPPGQTIFSVSMHPDTVIALMDSTSLRVTVVSRMLDIAIAGL